MKRELMSCTARTPLRVSFVGGGSDLPGFYEFAGPGAVVSAAIDHYVTVEVRHRADGSGAGVGASKHEACISAVLASSGLSSAQLDISIIPPFEGLGAGLGSSSAVTSSLVAAINGFAGKRLARTQIAKLACDTELGALGLPIGKQDQYACAVGGMNFIEFCSDGSVNIEPLTSHAGFIEHIREHVLIFDSGERRRSGDILAPIEAGLRQQINVDRVKLLRDLAYRCRESVIREDIAGFIATINEGWQAKQQLSQEISSRRIDTLMRDAFKAGAVGGKLLGAGGGGHILFLAPPSSKSAVRSALSMLPELPFQIDYDGTQVC